MSNEKPTNPKDAIGIQKPYFSTIPEPFVAWLGLAMLEGACKYGRHNYRAAGARVSVYYDACMRHLKAFWEGQDIDPASGVHHLIKASACMAVVFDSLVIQKNAVDDRPPKSPEGWLEEVERMTAALLAKYPEPKAAFTEARDAVDPFTVPHEVRSQYSPGLGGSSSAVRSAAADALQRRIEESVVAPFKHDGGGERAAEPARILVRDLQPEHAGLTFRVVSSAGTPSIPEGALLPAGNEAQPRNARPDFEGDYAFTQNGIGWWLGPDSVLEFVE